MASIVVRDLGFSYEGSFESVFEDASFAFDTDWRLGLVGRNGRGKTTLLRILSGELPYSGVVNASCKFPVFPYAAPDATKSAYEIADDITPGHEFWELCREVNLLGLSEDLLLRPYETLSGGERTKLGIAALFLDDGDFPLIDEPTNHLDQAGRDIMQEYLARKNGFLLVSHDRALLDAVCDHTMSINRQGIEVVSGNFSQWHENKTAQDRAEETENRRLKKDILRHREAASRTADWADKVEKTKKGAGPVDRGFIGHKSAKMMKRAKAAESRQSKAAERKETLMKDIDRAGTLKLTPLIHHTKRLVTLKDISVSYGRQTIIRGFEMEVMQGERVAVSGPNGCGKSSVIKLIAGESVPYSGEVQLASGLTVSYVPQDTEFLAGSLAAFAERAYVDRTAFTTILMNLGFERHDLDSDLASLSEGQKKKILLARSLATPAHLFLWDEPFNFIDVISRVQLEALILEYEPTMVFVEHDAVFAERVATRTLDIGGLSSSRE